MNATGKFQPKPPIYILPHAIEVIGEYPPRGANRYWRVRIRPHPFFTGKVVAGGVDVRRSRAVMSSILGRGLLPSEHVHHKNENREDDSPTNLELISPKEHNARHKTGARHSEESKQLIGASLKRAYQERRRAKPVITNRDEKGRIAP